MKFKTDISVSEEKNSTDQQGLDTSIPKMVVPITTVSSPKSKKTTTTKSPKTKRGESKAPLSMADLYEKENLFVSTMVEPSYGTSVIDLKSADVEANPEIAFDVATSIAEKGTLVETLPPVVSEFGRKLGLEDLN